MAASRREQISVVYNPKESVTKLNLLGRASEAPTATEQEPFRVPDRFRFDFGLEALVADPLSGLRKRVVNGSYDYRTKESGIPVFNGILRDNKVGESVGESETLPLKVFYGDRSYTSVCGEQQHIDCWGTNVRQTRTLSGGTSYVSAAPRALTSVEYSEVAIRQGLVFESMMIFIYGLSVYFENAEKRGVSFLENAFVHFDVLCSNQQDILNTVTSFVDNGVTQINAVKLEGRTRAQTAAAAAAPKTYLRGYARAADFIRTKQARYFVNEPGKSLSNVGFVFIVNKIGRDLQPDQVATINEFISEKVSDPNEEARSERSETDIRALPRITSEIRTRKTEIGSQASLESAKISLEEAARQEALAEALKIEEEAQRQRQQEAAAQAEAAAAQAEQAEAKRLAAIEKQKLEKLEEQRRQAEAEAAAKQAEAANSLARAQVAETIETDPAAPILGRPAQELAGWEAKLIAITESLRNVVEGRANQSQLLANSAAAEAETLATATAASAIATEDPSLVNAALRVEENANIAIQASQDAIVPAAEEAEIINANNDYKDCMNFLMLGVERTPPEGQDPSYRYGILNPDSYKKNGEWKNIEELSEDQVSTLLKVFVQAFYATQVNSFTDKFTQDVLSDTSEKTTVQKFQLVAKLLKRQQKVYEQIQSITLPAPLYQASFVDEPNDAFDDSVNEQLKQKFNDFNVIQVVPDKYYPTRILASAIDILKQIGERTPASDQKLKDLANAQLEKFGQQIPTEAEEADGYSKIVYGILFSPWLNEEGDELDENGNPEAEPVDIEKYIVTDDFRYNLLTILTITVENTEYRNFLQDVFDGSDVTNELLAMYVICHMEILMTFVAAFAPLEDKTTYFDAFDVYQGEKFKFDYRGTLIEILQNTVSGAAPEGQESTVSEAAERFNEIDPYTDEPVATLYDLALFVQQNLVTIEENTVKEVEEEQEEVQAEEEAEEPQPEISTLEAFKVKTEKRQSIFSRLVRKIKRSVPKVSVAVASFAFLTSIALALSSYTSGVAPVEAAAPGTAEPLFNQTISNTTTNAVDSIRQLNATSVNFTDPSLVNTFNATNFTPSPIGSNTVFNQSIDIITDVNQTGALASLVGEGLINVDAAKTALTNGILSSVITPVAEAINILEETASSPAGAAAPSQGEGGAAGGGVAPSEVAPPQSESPALTQAVAQQALEELQSSLANVTISPEADAPGTQNRNEINALAKRVKEGRAQTQVFITGAPPSVIAGAPPSLLSVPSLGQQPETRFRVGIQNPQLRASAKTLAASVESSKTTGQPASQIRVSRVSKFPLTSVAAAAQSAQSESPAKVLSAEPAAVPATASAAQTIAPNLEQYLFTTQANATQPAIPLSPAGTSPLPTVPNPITALNATQTSLPANDLSVSSAARRATTNKKTYKITRPRINKSGLNGYARLEKVAEGIPANKLTINNLSIAMNSPIQLASLRAKLNALQNQPRRLASASSVQRRSETSPTSSLSRRSSSGGDVVGQARTQSQSSPQILQVRSVAAAQTKIVGVIRIHERRFV